MQYGPTGVTSEGVREWTPPPGFENPVPEPGGPLRKGGCGCSVVVLILFAAIGVGVALLWPTIKHTYTDTKQDVEKFVDDTKEALDISTAGDGQTTTGINADGQSDMPGGGARLRYKVLPDSSEWTIVRGTEPELIGSEWGMQREGNDGTSSMRLERQGIGTTLDEAQIELIRDNIPIGVGDGGVSLRDDRIRTSSRTTDKDGSRQLYVSYAGSEDTYGFVCSARPDDSGFWRTCVAADRTLRFND